MDPPDTRLSVKGIADALGLREREARRHLVRLSEMAYVRPFRVRNEAYYTLTLFSIQEIKSMQEKSIETEVSTSRVGFLLRRSKKTGLLK
jgi:predicted ArsR family transcriptional regulator